MVNQCPCKDVVEVTGAQETDTSSGWVTIELKGAGSQDAEVGMSHLQDGAVSGVLKEPQQQSDTEKELALAAEHIDAINRTVPCLSDAEQQFNKLCIEAGLEDVSAIMQNEMDVVKLFAEFRIDKFWTVEKKLEELEQKKQQYNSECSKLSVLLLVIDTKLACLEECEASMFKGHFPEFDDMCGDAEIRQMSTKLKKRGKQFKSLKALQTQIKKRVERELKEKRQKKEEIEMLCAQLHETMEKLHTQIVA